MQTETEVSPGTVIDGRYHVESVLGEGASATVYLARQTSVGRRVAVKVLHPDLDTDEDTLACCEREALVVASLHHPNIVAVHDVGRLPTNQTYMVMEHVHGHTLAILLQHGPLATDRVLAIFEQVARALRHAHRRGIVHRDLKPANVLIAASSRGADLVKLTDFGIARDVVKDHSSPGAVVGTPYYMSPEQARGEPADGRSDLYAVGAMMYRACTGSRPFEARTSIDVLEAQMHAPIPPMHEIAPHVHVPPELEAIVLKCLEKRPEDRFQDAEQLIDALVPLRRATIPDSLLPFDTSWYLPPPVRSRRPAWVWAALVAIGALFAAIFLGFAGAVVWSSTAASVPPGQNELPTSTRSSSR